MLTQQTAHALFIYSNGELLWKSDSPYVKAGTVAGSVKKSKHRQVSVNGIKYNACDIIYLYHHGTFPKGGIMHINGDITDNRIENLQDVSLYDYYYNEYNNPIGESTIAYIEKTNTFEVRVNVFDVDIVIGKFKSQDEAFASFLAAKARLVNI